MGKNILNVRELVLCREAIDLHLSVLRDMEEITPYRDEKMRQFKALLDKLPKGDK